MTDYEHGTWLAPEEHAYPAGGQTRKGLAIYPDGKLRRVWGGIPDTFFSIPAHGRLGGRYVRGYLSIDDKYIPCPNILPALFLQRHADGGLHCELCKFGLMDSPTRGALVFHVYERSAR